MVLVKRNDEYIMEDVRNGDLTGAFMRPVAECLMVNLWKRLAFERTKGLLTNAYKNFIPSYTM